jgi:hypothetical protein
LTEQHERGAGGNFAQVMASMPGPRQIEKEHGLGSTSPPSLPCLWAEALRDGWAMGHLWPTGGQSLMGRGIGQEPQSLAQGEFPDVAAHGRFCVQRKLLLPKRLDVRFEHTLR